MVDIWIPGYTRVDLGPDGGVYDDRSNPKGCVHTTEGSTLAGAEAAYRNYPPHIGYDPIKRTKHQYVALNRYSYAFRGAESDDEYIIQIETVGFAKQTHLWSDQVYRNFAEDVIKPLEDLIGIPRTSLQFHGEGEGIILANERSPIRLSATQLRNYRGWLGHQHIPSPDSHWDPGRFLIQKSFNYLGNNTMAIEDDVKSHAHRWWAFQKGQETVPADVGAPVGIHNEPLKMVTDLQSAMGRLQALSANLPNVVWGPASGEKNELHNKLNEISLGIAEIKAMISQGFTLIPQGQITVSVQDPPVS